MSHYPPPPPNWDSYNMLDYEELFAKLHNNQMLNGLNPQFEESMVTRESVLRKINEIFATFGTVEGNTQWVSKDAIRDAFDSAKEKLSQQAKETSRQITNQLYQYIQDNPEAKQAYGYWARSPMPLNYQYEFHFAQCDENGIYKLPHGIREIVTIDLDQFKRMLQGGEI